MKKRMICMALLITICVALAACGATAPKNNVGNFEFMPENYPKMGGSLAALPLGEAVTAAVLGIDRAQSGDYIVFQGSTTDNYRGLMDRRFDLLLAYEPSEAAKKEAKNRDFAWEMTPIGRDALVFIVNKANPVNELSTAQIRDIYSGKITNWSEVGGNDAPIIAYQRNKESGSQTLFDKLVGLGASLMKAPSEKMIGSMIGLVEAVAEYDNAADSLGYTVYYYLANMEKEKLNDTKILAVDGAVCTNDTIQSGKYPYVNDFYAVIPKGLPDDDPARVLYNWICGAQGQELAARENYVVKAGI